MTISAVVVSYRPGRWLAPCLASLSRQVDELLVMDNGSEGAKASELALAAGARVARSEVNTGYAPAVDHGASLAKGDVLVLLNDDAVAGPNWVRSACDLLAQPSVAAVGPKVVLGNWYREVVLTDEAWHAQGDPRPLGRQVHSVTVAGNDVLTSSGGPGLHRLERGAGGQAWRWTAGAKPWYVPMPDDWEEGDEVPVVLVDGEPAPAGRVTRLVNSAGSFLDSRGYAGDIGEDSADDGAFDEQAERFAISGCAFATRMGTWRSLGPFASQFFAYYEDVDWCWRARLAGMKVVYDPAATVVHRRSTSSGGRHNEWVRVMAERNRTLSMVRNGPGSLALRAVADRWANGPDGGIRRGVARLLPWALAARARSTRRWSLSPQEVWDTWVGVDARPPE